MVTPHQLMLSFVVVGTALVASGCRSPYYSDRGALVGGLGGAGVGAIVGNAVGSTVAGTAIGAGVGALTGNAIGGAMDDLAAQNRAEIAAQLGRPVVQGAANVEEVVAMSRSGVDPRLIINYVNSSGISRPLNAQDVIYLHQQGVSTDVINVMQTPQVAAQPVRIASPPPHPVIIEEYHHGPYYCPPRHHFYYRHGHHRHHHHPRVGFGISIAN